MLDHKMLGVWRSINTRERVFSLWIGYCLCGCRTCPTLVRGELYLVFISHCLPYFRFLDIGLSHFCLKETMKENAILSLQPHSIKIFFPELVTTMGKSLDPLNILNINVLTNLFCRPTILLFNIGLPFDWVKCCVYV